MMKLFKYFIKPKTRSSYHDVMFKCVNKYENNEKKLAQSIIDSIIFEHMDSDLTMKEYIDQLLIITKNRISYAEMIKDDFERGLIMLMRKTTILQNIEQKHIINEKIIEYNTFINYCDFLLQILYYLSNNLP
ncbi:hypothetical protein [Powai lake megavirus]|uniref:Uncharacterized protein n=1 Tax=Powai lake megavirus TaxID=1842663 RepID=A0A167R4Z6_9VIRU|nr:hypothetical protein QJ849_gp153 [Powai lake megavirus]ANB50315.1 hypothetical protein [Powai lake megavirus]